MPKIIFFQTLLIINRKAFIDKQTRFLKIFLGLHCRVYFGSFIFSDELQLFQIGGSLGHHPDLQFFSQILNLIYVRTYCRMFMFLVANHLHAVMSTAAKTRNLCRLPDIVENLDVLLFFPPWCLFLWLSSLVH